MNSLPELSDPLPLGSQAQKVRLPENPFHVRVSGEFVTHMGIVRSYKGFQAMIGLQADLHHIPLNPRGKRE